MGVLMDYVKDRAEEKGKNPVEWLQNIATKASQCRIGTHMGKFVHPNANVILQDMLPEADVKGYVTTSTVNCDIDISTNAAYLGTAKFLLLELDDGITVYEHMKKILVFWLRNYQILIWILPLSSRLFYQLRILLYLQLQMKDFDRYTS